MKARHLDPARAQYAVALQDPFIRGAGGGVLPRRLPADIISDDLNFLDPLNSHFVSPFALVSWGQYLRGQPQGAPGIIGARDRTKTTILGDSGGYQFIGDPTLYEGASTARRSVAWLESNTDLAMTLDIPTRAISPSGRWASFQACLADTLTNLHAIMDSRGSTATRFLNVLQGRDLAECRQWYKAVKDYRFDGWAFGGESRQLPIMLELIARMVEEDRVGSHLHVLGSSSMTRAVELTALKRALAVKGIEVEVTFDTATPSIMAANNQLVSWLKVNGKDMVSAVMPLAVNPDLRDQHLPFPVTGTFVGDRVDMADLIVRGGAAQSGIDAVSHLLLTHHNIEQTHRLMEQSNRIVDLAAYRTDMAPTALLQRVNDIGKFLTRADPKRYISGHLRGFSERLDPEHSE